MMRLFRLLIALGCLAAGVAIGALNAQPVALDLGFTALRSSLGVVVLVSLLVGAVAGGAVLALSVVLPLQHRIRQLRGRPSVNAASGHDSAGGS